MKRGYGGVTFSKVTPPTRIMKIAIVTGASSGIGREFAMMLDRHEKLDEIWVIARREERLRELSGVLKTKVRPVPLDLMRESSYETYKALLAEQSPEVKVLVNGAGYGYFGEFTERTLEGQLGMIDCNSRAVVALTYLTLPYMKEGGEIYNIASTSSFQPVPYIAVYGATKAFVMSFSRAVNREVRPRGIRVMAVCPHWCKTEFFDTAVTDDTIKYYNFFNDARDVAETAWRNMKRGRDVSLCGYKIKLQRLAVKLMPHSFVMNTWCRQQKKPTAKGNKY